MPTLMKNTELGTFFVVDDERVDEMVAAHKPGTAHEKSNIAPGLFVVANADEVRKWLDEQPEVLSDSLFDTDERNPGNAKTPKGKPIHVVKDLAQKPSGQAKPKPPKPAPIDPVALQSELSRLQQQLAEMQDIMKKKDGK